MYQIGMQCGEDSFDIQFHATQARYDHDLRIHSKLKDGSWRQVTDPVRYHTQ